MKRYAIAASISVGLGVVIVGGIYVLSIMAAGVAAMLVELMLG